MYAKLAKSSCPLADHYGAIQVNQQSLTSIYNKEQEKFNKIFTCNQLLSSSAQQALNGELV